MVPLVIRAQSLALVTAMTSMHLEQIPQPQRSPPAVPRAIHVQSESARVKRQTLRCYSGRTPAQSQSQGQTGMYFEAWAAQLPTNPMNASTTVATSPVGTPFVEMNSARAIG